MATNTAQHSPGAKLTGVTADRGECTHCGRELGKVYEVAHADGTVATYGRRCCARVTGYKGSQLDGEARAALRTAVLAARRAQVTAAYPDFAHLLDESHYVDGQMRPMGAAYWSMLTAVTSDYLWVGLDELGRGWSPFADWREYLAFQFAQIERGEIS